MAAAKRKKEGVVAFAAGIIAAPLVGVAAVAFVVGVGLIWYASGDTPEAEDDVAFGFAEPDDIQASEVEARRSGTTRSKPRRAKPRPSRASTPAAPRTADRSSPPPDPAHTDGSADATPAQPASQNDPGTQAQPHSDRPAMPPSPERENEGGPRPTAQSVPTEGEAVDLRARPGRDADRSGVDPFSPPKVAGPTPAPTTRTRSPNPGTGTGPHPFPEDEGPSWIPNTFRSVVESGIAMLTGEAPPDDAASTEGAPPAMPEAAPDPSPGSPSPDAPSPSPARSRASSPTPGRGGDGAADPTGTQQARPDDAAPITPSGSGEPNPSVVPETSAMPSVDPNGPMPFAPESASPTRADGTTIDNLVSGGLDMVTGKGAPDVAPAPTRTRTATEMEEDVADYVDPAAGGGEPAALDFEDDYSVEIEEHDAASSFGTAESEEDITAPVDPDALVIPVRIRTAAPGIEVRVDGKSLGVSPARSDLSDHDHTVVLGTGADRTTFTITPMANPDEWCFDTKSTGGYRQVPCD